MAQGLINAHTWVFTLKIYHSKSLLFRYPHPNLGEGFIFDRFLTYVLTLEDLD